MQIFNFYLLNFTDLGIYRLSFDDSWRGLLFTHSDNNFGILMAMIETTIQL